MKGGFIMHNLDDLIQDIYENETIDIPGNISFAQKKDIKNK